MSPENRNTSTGSVQACQNCRKNFTVDPEDSNFYEKIKVPPPTWCPECRMLRRMVFWNEHNLFRKKEAIAGKEIFSTFPEEANVKIYDHDYWWSDQWNPLSYGKDYDFTRPFFEQYHDLIKEMPWPATAVRGMVNSDYSNQASYLKNCYLCFNCENAEDCLYGVGFQRMKQSVDFYWTITSELCYELAFSDGMYQSFFCTHSSNCRDSWFLMDCDDCSNCFGCIGLRHKQYHIFNEPYSKEEYFKKLAEFNLGSYGKLSELKGKVYDFWLKFPYKYIHGSQNENVSGEYVWNSKNCKYVFQGSNMDNVRYSQNMGFDIKDSYDYTNWGQVSQLIYDSVGVGDACKNVKFSFDCWPGIEDVEYSMSCHSSANLFGCFGLKKKRYCILNKEYPREEYFALREKIIEHMDKMPYIVKTKVQNSKTKNIEERELVYRYGEFFPPEFSPLAYNETVAIDYCPAPKGEVVQKGYLWRDPHPREYQVTVAAAKLPDHVNDAGESITKETIGCASCERAFRIIPREFEFYKRFSLPLPRLCPSCRQRDRLAWRNPLKWFQRKCQCAGKTSDLQLKTENRYTNAVGHFHGEDHCSNEFQTSYAPDRKEIVYCEACYQSEVI